jgi:hypothetical protein
MLQVIRLMKFTETKENRDEHCEQGTCDAQIFYFMAYDRNGSRPDAEENEDMPAPKECGGENCIPEGRTERSIMCEGVRKIRTVVGRCHRELNCKKE